MAKDKDTPDTPPAAPDPWVLLDRLATALERANQNAQSSNNQELMPILTKALDRLADAQLDGARLLAAENRRTHRPSNEVVPKISVFNRRGEGLPADAKGPRKPPLKCAMMIPFLVEWESITREEAELLNLLEPGEYRLSLTDKSKVKMQVKVDYKLNSTVPSRLLLNNVGEDGQPGTAFNKDNAHKIPALSDMLRNLLLQHDPEIKARAAMVMSDEEEEALIEAGLLTVTL